MTCCSQAGKEELYITNSSLAASALVKQTQDEFQASTEYGPEIWYSVAYTTYWPLQACEPGDRTGLEERNSARLTHMLLPTGNPSDLSGKLQGENITVTSEPYFVEKSMQLRKQIWIGQIFLAMKNYLELPHFSLFKSQSQLRA